VNAHRLAEDRSLALHCVIAERIARDPSILERARERVATWIAEGRAPHYARAWQLVLAGPAAEVIRTLVADTEEGRALRQATPFAGVVEPRERWRIWARVRDGA
jgi:hypothetical protein